MLAQNTSSLSLANVLRPEVRANPYTRRFPRRRPTPIHHTTRACAGWPTKPSRRAWWSKCVRMQIVYRSAAEEVELGGKRIGKGQLVNLVVGAANRDPAQFDEPDRFDLSRPEGRHVGLGMGIHFCLGAPLARLEGQIALTTLLRRFPRLRLETEALEWQESPTFRGLKSLPVAV